MWNIQSPHEDNLSSCESYKIITSKALGTMYAQHSLISGTFGKDRSTTMNDFPVIGDLDPVYMEWGAPV